MSVQPEYVRASQLRKQQKHCPACRVLSTTFKFERWIGVEDGNVMAAYVCTTCGRLEELPVFVDEPAGRTETGP